MRRRFISALVITAALLAAAPVAGAATFVVDRTDDPGGAGACTDAANDCSLLQAVTLANANADADTIQLAAATYAFPGPIGLTKPATIAGAGARVTTLRPVSLGVYVGDPVAVELRDLAISGARNGGPGFGAGVFVNDTGVDMTLRRVAITDNQASGDPQYLTQHYFGAGAAVRFSGKTLTIEDSLFANNQALAGATGLAAQGGGLWLGFGTTVIRNSTIAGNAAYGSSTAPAQGAGIWLADARSLELENVTLSGNALAGGSDPTYGASEGAQLWRGPASTVTIRGSVIAHGFTPPATDCNRVVTTTAGGNVQDRNDCGLGTADKINADPLLGFLGNNGGPTDTLALLAGSPAIGFAGACGLPGDQRGVARVGTACSAGAFEYVAPPVALPVVEPPPKPFCSLLASGDGAGLRALAVCDLAVSFTLTTTATIYPLAPRRGSKKPALKQVRLRVSTGGLLPGRFGALRVAVPKSVRTALARKQRVAIAMDLAATTAAGAHGSAGASIRALKRAPKAKAKAKPKAR